MDERVHSCCKYVSLTNIITSVYYNLETSSLSAMEFLVLELSSLGVILARGTKRACSPK